MLKTVLAAALVVSVFVTTPSGPVAAAKPPTHVLQVSGTGVGSYPAYDASIRRYAATTTQATYPSNVSDPIANTGATVTVTATTSDASGVVLVNGVPSSSDSVTLTGVDAGDEISVVFEDSGGREANAVYVLPADFPTLTATVKKPGITPGLVGLTMFEFQDPTMPRLQAMVDVNGVPVWTRASMATDIDLKRQPNGSYTYARPVTPGPTQTGSEIVELDSGFQEVATHRATGLVDTDSHDSILAADGSKVFVSYEVNAATGRTDSVIQEVNADGDVVFEWDSADLVAETVTPNQVGSDYAHINSIEIANGGEDFLASFRGLSAVLLIARQAHDGFQPGDIVWKVGGRDSSLTFVDDALQGPCAQHSARQLPDGDVMIFDNGSVGVLGDGPNCVDQADPTGALETRAQSRVSVYHVDTTAHTATLVREYAPSGWFSWFMGSAQYFPANDHILVGWAAETRALAEEVDADGEPVWRLVASKTAANDQTYISYRATKFDAPDEIDPAVTVSVPTEGASYEHGQIVRTDFTCTDNGGSTLQTCGDEHPGTRLDTTTSGPHTYTVEATDGAGNTSTVVRHYTVGPVVHRPDMSVRRSDGTWLGTRDYGPLPDQTATWRIRRGAVQTIRFAITNRGNVAERFTVDGTAGNGSVHATYRFEGRDVTRRVVDGTWRAPSTGPGKRQVLVLEIRVKGSTAVGLERRFTVRSAAGNGTADRSAALVRVR